jgi:hypothetical protein
MAKLAVTGGVKERALQLSGDQTKLLAETAMKAIGDPRCGLSEDQKVRLRKAMARELRLAELDPEQLALAKEIIARHERRLPADPFGGYALIAEQPKGGGGDG